MASLIRTERQGDTLELILDTADQGPALANPALRRDILNLLQSPGPDARAILLRGAKVSVFDGPELPGTADRHSPTVADLCQAVEHSALPVVFLVEGPASGRGAEFVLSGHARVATPQGSMVFGALQLGLVQGAGATQRLPRLIGAEQSLRLLATGSPVRAAEAAALGLFDQIVDHGDADRNLTAARSYAANMSNPRPALSRTEGLSDSRGFLREISAARARRTAADLPVASALIDCVEAAMLLPPDQGLQFEATLAEEMAETDAAAALIYVHRAEVRNLGLPQGLNAFSPAPVRRIGVSGAEKGVIGLISSALSRGYQVNVADPDREKLAGLLSAVAERQESLLRSGQLSEEQRDADWARLAAAMTTDSLADCGLLIVADRSSVPPAVAAKPILYCGRGAIPAGAFRLVLTGRIAELALPPSSPGPLAITAWAILRRLGLRVVLTGQQTAAGISGRLIGASGAALRALAEIGVAPARIGSALSAAGYPVIGLPEATGTAERDMPPAEIVDRWLGALANEAARLLQAGVTQTASDIDIVAISGLGFPRHSGGPLHQADQRGALVLRRDLAAWSKDHVVWAPVPALDALVSLGRGFAGALRTG